MSKRELFRRHHNAQQYNVCHQQIISPGRHALMVPAIQEEDIIQAFIVARHTLHGTGAAAEAADFPRIVIELSCLMVAIRQTNRPTLSPIRLPIVLHLPGSSGMTATDN